MNNNWISFLITCIYVDGKDGAKSFMSSCLPIANKWRPNEKTNEWKGYLCMWTVRIVWLRLLCSFMLCVPIARFFKPSSNTANRSSSSAHSILETEILDKIYRRVLKKLCKDMFKHLNRLSTTKALLRLFQRTVRLDRFAPGLSKSITWIGIKIGEIWYLKTRSYLLVIDFEVGGFYYEGCVVFVIPNVITIIQMQTQPEINDVGKL